MSHDRFASLTGELLVRKGAAAPSAGAPGAQPPRLTPVEPSGGDALRRDVASSDESIGHRFGRAPARVVPVSPDKEPAPADVRLRVRLTREQARKLRLAGAVLDLSQQEILARAVRDHLTALGHGPLRDCGCFHGTNRVCGH